MLLKELPLEDLPENLTVELPFKWLKSTGELQNIKTVGELAMVIENLRVQANFTEEQELLLDVIEAFLVGFEELIGMNN
jgi:hypothetical protein